MRNLISEEKYTNKNIRLYNIVYIKYLKRLM